MAQLNRVEVFLEVAKYQSFSEAAKALRITGPAASKQVAALEESLGVKLLHRTTRSVTLTEEGAAYYARARLAMEELKEAAEQLREARGAPSGTLKISAPLSFGHMHLLPALSGFAQKYPRIVMDISLDDRMVDASTEGFDVVIRIGALRDSSLIARRMAACPIHAYASPDYIRAHGLPSTPRDLKAHRLISYSYAGGAGEWRYRDKNGKTGSVKINGALRANTAEMMLQAALDGVGIAILPTFVAATHQNAGQLVQLLPDYETHPAREVVALLHPNRYRSKKIQLFVEWLMQACKSMPLE